ncbi:hypothetical protein EV426DRAFT_665610 [Tirmania nivea]|nr:hypothetical protein EV426DRAFT_665610 [Tirmania nivea]
MRPRKKSTTCHKVSCSVTGSECCMGIDIIGQQIYKYFSIAMQCICKALQILHMHSPLGRTRQPEGFRRRRLQDYTALEDGRRVAIMPRSGKSKGGKGKGGRQIQVPSFQNAPPTHKTPEPTQLPTPANTPAVLKIKTAPKSIFFGPAKGIERFRDMETVRRDLEVITEGTEVGRKVRKEVVDSDDELFESCSETGESSEEEEYTCGPWVAKGNPPGYLDSDDERELEEAGVVAVREKRDSITDWQWKELGDFFIQHIGAFLEIGDQEAENHLLDELLGEFDEGEVGRGRVRVSKELNKIQKKMEDIQGLEDEVEELKERLEWERKRNSDLAVTNRGLIEDKRNTEAEEKFEQLSNFLADTIRCSRGRPVATLIGAVEDHLEKLEVRSREDPKFRNLKSETQRKTEELKKIKEEKKVWVEEKKKMEERLASVQREPEQEQTLTQVPKPVKKIETVEVGIQASPDMVDVITETQEEVPVEKKKKQRQRQSKEKVKKKEGAKDSNRIQEDVEMVDEERFTLYEDLSDYEKEEVVKDEAPVTPPVTKKQPVVRQTGPKAAKSPAAKHKKPAKPVKVKDIEYVDTRAFVVHGIPCHRPMADTIQDVRKTGMRGIIGARWLLGGHRRTGKTTSSVVVFLNNLVSFHVQGGQLGMKVRGRCLPVEVYDFERGRKRSEVTDSGSDSGW